jgi:hypothetical protein
VLVLALGWPGPWPPGTVLVAAVVLVLALGVGTVAVLRLGSVERGDGRR